MVDDGRRATLLFITGDLHGGTFSGKLEPGVAPPALYECTKDDHLVVLGDFGLPWPGQPNNEENLRWLEERPWTTLFIDGNHENYAELAKLEPEPFLGGTAARLPSHPGIVHLLRGEVYEMDGLSVFCMGGASSVVDSDCRTGGVDWWPEELPGENELSRSRENLRDHGGSVSLVLTHDCSSRVLPRVVRHGPPARNRLNEWLDALEDEVGFRWWYFGHHHRDLRIDGRHACLFESVVEPGGMPGRP